MTNDLNTEAFSFIEKLSVIVPHSNPTKEKKVSQLKGIGEIIELGEVSNVGFEEFDEDTYLTKRKFKDIDSKLIGFETKEYSKFKEFVIKLLDNSLFSNKCDLTTLLDLCFEWVLNVYKTKKANTNLTDFLIDKIDSLTKEYHFYFKIKGLAIQNPITIGNATIKFFSEDEILQYYNKFKESKPDNTIQEFKEIYSLNEDTIHAFIKVKGVLNRANEIAFREAELAIDVLKCFCSHYSTEKFIRIFDIDYRLQQGSVDFDDTDQFISWQIDHLICWQERCSRTVEVGYQK